MSIPPGTKYRKPPVLGYYTGSAGIDTSRNASDQCTESMQVLPLLPLWLLGATEHSGNGTRVSKGTSQLPRSRELSCLNKSTSRTTMGKWSKHLLFEGTHFQEAGLISHAPLKYWRRDTGQIHLKEETSGERICPLDTREAAQDLFIQVILRPCNAARPVVTCRVSADHEGKSSLGATSPQFLTNGWGGGAGIC